jgi:hypothetical protein
MGGFYGLEPIVLDDLKSTYSEPVIFLPKASLCFSKCGVDRFVKFWWCCGELATPLLTVKPVGVYSTTLVQYLYISCYVTVNKPVLSYLSLCLLPQCWC